MELDQLGFRNRHRTPQLSREDDIELELEVGARLLRRAAAANGWDISEVDAVLVGVSLPVIPDYIDQVARRAGIREDALKVSCIRLAMAPSAASTWPSIRLWLERVS